jgi:hypothetical protein
VDNANRYAPFIMGIGPFKRFKPFNGSTVREASRQASSTAFSSEPCRGITMSGSDFRSFFR